MSTEDNINKGAMKLVESVLKAVKHETHHMVQDAYKNSFLIALDQIKLTAYEGIYGDKRDEN